VAWLDCPSCGRPILVWRPRAGMEVECGVCGALCEVEHNPSPEVEHLPSSAPFTFTVEVPKHETKTSVVLDPEPPYTPGEAFTAAITVECITARCNLECHYVEVYDHEGVRVGSGHLITPYMAPPEVNVAGVDLFAPIEEDTYTWIAKYLGGSPAASHILHTPSKVRIAVVSRFSRPD